MSNINQIRKQIVIKGRYTEGRKTKSGYQRKGIYANVIRAPRATPPRASPTSNKLNELRGRAAFPVLRGKISSAVRHTRPERDPYFVGKILPATLERIVTCSPAKEVTMPGTLPARVTAWPPSELITV